MDREKLKNILGHIIIILLILIASVVWINTLCQNDVFFDIKTGEDILKYGIDFKDHFSFIPNLTYIYHHFLYDLIIYKIYKLFDFTGIFFFFLFVYSILGLIIYKINYKYTNKKILSGIIAIFSLYLLKSYCSNRVQTITYLLFFLEVYFLNNLYKTGNKKNIIYLFLISILIVNMHMPLWIFTIVLCLPYLGEIILFYLKDKIEFLNKIISNKIVCSKPKNTKIFIITLILLFVSGFCSPLKLYPYTFFIKALGNHSYDIIVEMQQTILFNRLSLLSLIIIMFGSIIFFKLKINFRDLALVSGLFVFSLMAFRNIAYVYLFYPTIFGKLLVENNFKLNFKIKKIPYINANIFNSLLIVILFSCYLNCLYLFRGYKYFIDDIFPDEITSYIKTNLDYKNITLFNEFNVGSYLAFYDIPVFIDSRAEVYIKEFNGGTDIIGDYRDISEYDSYRNILNKYNFNYLLVYKDSILDSYLKDNINYQEVYNEQDIFVLYKEI